MIARTENVWDYPRPAICEPFAGSLKVVMGDQVLAETSRGYRTLETSHPPTYYFPPDDIRMEFLKRNKHTSLCEWKGKARYLDFHSDRDTVRNIGWYYADPTPGFVNIEGFVSFYAYKTDACYVDGEQVMAQEGDFYGGWITSNLQGPFKGGIGTLGW